MTNKSVYEFTKLDEAYKVLDKFYFGEQGEEESLLDQLDSAYYKTVGGDPESYDRFYELIDQVREMVGDAMGVAIKVAVKKLTEVERVQIPNSY